MSISAISLFRTELFSYPTEKKSEGGVEKKSDPYGAKVGTKDSSTKKTQNIKQIKFLFFW